MLPALLCPSHSDSTQVSVTFPPCCGPSDSFCKLLGRAERVRFLQQQELTQAAISTCLLELGHRGLEGQAAHGSSLPSWRGQPSHPLPAPSAPAQAAELLTAQPFLLFLCPFFSFSLLQSSSNWSWLARCRHHRHKRVQCSLNCFDPSPACPRGWGQTDRQTDRPCPCPGREVKLNQATKGCRKPAREVWN